MKKLAFICLFILAFSSNALSANKVVVIPLWESPPEQQNSGTTTPPVVKSSIDPERLALLQWFPNLTHIQDDIVTDSGAGAVAFDGTNIWVGNRDPEGADSTIDVLDLSGANVTAQFSVHSNCQGPVAFAFDGKATMWTACRESTVAALYNTSTRSLQTTLSVGTQPTYISFDGKNMWVSNTGANTVSVYNAASPYSLVTTITVPNQPYGSATDGINMWVVGMNSTTAYVYANANMVLQMTPGSGGTGALDIAYDGANMWLTNFKDSTITILKASDGSLVDTLASSDGVGVKPTYIAFDGIYMWVTNEDDDNISIFRASDFVHVKDINVQSNPQRIAYDGNNMWITNSGTGSVSKR